MAPSRWNMWTERLIGSSLTVHEHRLALVLARLLLGWNRLDAPLGQKLLRDMTDLDGRSFERARKGLVEKGLLDYQSGGPGGRGKRSVYRIILERQESTAPQRTFREPRKYRSGGKKVPLHSGDALIEAREEKPEGDLIRACFEAYLSTGGTLELEKERKALGQQASSLLKSGTDPELLLAACRDLGRKREFPGFLKQRVAQFVESGLPCTWSGLPRQQLTEAQLRECGCSTCAEWLAPPQKHDAVARLEEDGWQVTGIPDGRVLAERDGERFVHATAEALLALVETAANGDGHDDK